MVLELTTIVYYICLCYLLHELVYKYNMVSIVGLFIMYVSLVYIHVDIGVFEQYLPEIKRGYYSPIDFITYDQYNGLYVNIEEI